MTATAPNTGTAVQLLATLNQLIIKAFNCKSQKALSFLILNDTVQLVQYDRATLWDISRIKPKLLGASGQTKKTVDSETARTIRTLIRDIKEPHKIQIILKQSFKKEQALFEKFQKQGTHSAILWVPVMHEGKFLVGLWLDRWHETGWHKDEVNILLHLSRGYAPAWSKFHRKWKFPKLSATFLGGLFTCLVGLTFFIQVPLRIVAPCEVVPKEPFLVSAPLNGIIEEMIVTPGQKVEVGELLFLYDKRVPLQELQIAKKKVDIAQSQLNRAMTLGVRDPKSLTETAIWQLELEKEKLNLNLAEFQAGKLEVKAEENGIASFENPDEWRGRPVQIGERVMLLTDPQKTKIKIWIPEKDNVTILPEEPLKIFLNIDPLTTYKADLVYISEYSKVSEKGVPSFVAEAEWIEEPKDIKIGLKGSAILYGEEVTLFYYLTRRPIDTVRRFTGY